MKRLKKIISLVIVLCFTILMVTEHTYAATQKNNITYVTENGEEAKFKQVAAGYYHSLGLTTDGQVYAWGRNNYGQIGDNTTADKNAPVFIMDNVRFIVASAYQSYAITNKSELYAWGLNTSGELGDGTKNNKLVPTKIMDNIKSVAGGNAFSMALTVNGEVYIWGSNAYGAVGISSASIVPIKLMDGVQEIAANQNISLALKTNGDMYFWGSVNINATTVFPSQYIPTVVMQNITHIACGDTTVYAINNHDEIYGWGYLNGVLLERTAMLTPAKMFDNARGLSAHQHMLYLDKNNTLFVWGRGTSWQLGQGVNVDNNEPTKRMENVISVAAGGNYSLAVTTSGELYVWGSNQYGQLGYPIVAGGMLTIPMKLNIYSGSATPRLVFSNKELTITKDNSMYIRARVYNSTTKEATWTSSNETVATVDDYGNVTAIAVGTSTITMTTGDGLSDTCIVTVTEDEVDIPEKAILSLLLRVGDGTQLSVSHLLADNLKFTWFSTDDAVVTVNNNGYINAISEGLIRIYAETDEESYYINVRVISGDSTEPQEYQLAVDLQVYETAQLYLTDEDGVIWNSMDNSVASIDSEGKVTAISTGLAIVTAEFDGETYVFYVRVR